VPKVSPINGGVDAGGRRTIRKYFDFGLYVPPALLVGSLMPSDLRGAGSSTKALVPSALGIGTVEKVEN
jgi:hypothetical protein